MTTHTNADLTERWLTTSHAGMLFFKEWAAWYAPIRTRCRIQLAVAEWCPHMDDFVLASGWISSLDFRCDHPAYLKIVDLFWDEWIGSSHEHDAFHEWADDPDMICSGCWL